MRRIGGMFPLEPVREGTNGYLDSLGGDVLLMMSGRCAIHAALEDMGWKEPHTAYVPAYTCETVLSAYEKAGYRMIPYDIDPEEMRPVFRSGALDFSSVLNLCGYFGFCRYDCSFLSECRSRGITVLQDTTHSPFQVDPLADYAAVSLRKWMGVASGGVAVKRSGRFGINPLPPEKEHLEGRYKAFELRKDSLESGDSRYDDEASEVFWNTEMRLRGMFDAYAGDELSERIIESFDFEGMAELRRRNYQAVLDALGPENGYRVVFPSLQASDVPSHFTVYADDRDGSRAYLSENGVSSTVYWPRTPLAESIEGFDEAFPGASYIYDHVVSIQIDQRYSVDDMRYLASVLNGYRP